MHISISLAADHDVPLEIPELCFLSYPYQCDLCNRKYVQKEGLQKHLSGHIKYDVDTKSNLYKCCLCDEYFPKRDRVHSHLASHKLTYQHKCLICDRMFENKNLWSVHQYQHAGVSATRCQVCQKPCRNAHALYEHKQRLHTERERSHLCMACGNAFLSKNSLGAHMKQVHVAAVHSCDVCGLNFKTRGRMRSHRRIVHFTSADIKCKECGKMFKSNSRLQRHQTTVHSNKKTVCKICGLELSGTRTDYIKNHMISHEKVPYKLQCNYCPMKFKYTMLLTLHLHKHKGEVPIVCTYCKRTFPTEQSLRIHMKVHGVK